MGTGLLARARGSSRGSLGRRAVVVAAVAGAAAALAGCGTTSSSAVTASGTTLTIYSSVPGNTSDPALAQDLYRAEALALQGHTTIGKFTLKFVELTGKLPSDNARTAISDTKAIAYLGEVTPGTSADSMGINNAQDLLQVSATDTAIELTQSTSAVPGAPGSYYESHSTYGNTFARVVPSAAAEAKAQVAEMESRGVTTVDVVNDGTPYGKAIALAVKDDLPSTITSANSPSGASAMFCGCSSTSFADHTFNTAAQANPQVKLFGPSALDNSTFAAGMTAPTSNVYISSPGFLPRDLTSAGKTFVSDFTSTYGHAPDVQAIFGYEAMSALLGVIAEAGTGANNRATVIHDFFGIKNRPACASTLATTCSVLGTYSIDGAGDTSLNAFVFSRVVGGALVPFAAAPQG
jgi:ABC-type branched-subunit amino acid transport system substrate-binding protein